MNKIVIFNKMRKFNSKSEFNWKKDSLSNIIIRYGIKNKIKTANFKANISMNLSKKYSIYDVQINIKKNNVIFVFLLLNRIFMNA